MRFNGAPAGGGYAADVGSRTSVSILADVATTACIEGHARQPTLDAVSPSEAKLEGALLSEPTPGSRQV